MQSSPFTITPLRIVFFVLVSFALLYGMFFSLPTMHLLSMGMPAADAGLVGLAVMMLCANLTVTCTHGIAFSKRKSAIAAPSEQA